MAFGVRLSRLAWPALALLGAAAAWTLRDADPGAWDWQIARLADQPWRAFTAAAVHLSALHLRADLAGCAVVAAFGVAAGCAGRATLAWALAGPLTHLALLAEPALAHSAGLAGVLHAGVAVAAWQALARPPRWVGAAVLAGLALKLLAEEPWRGPLRPWPGGDIAVAPLAHAGGALAGLACAALLLGRTWRTVQ